MHYWNVALPNNMMSIMSLGKIMTGWGPRYANRALVRSFKVQRVI